MKYLVTAIVLALSTCSAWAAQGKGAKEGQAIYTRSCKGCHGPEGQGNPAIAKAMKVTIHPFSSPEVQSKSDADLKKLITQGYGKMKPVTSLKPDQVNDVIAYIRTLKK